MSDYQIVIDSAAVDVTIGTTAELRAEQAVQYIKSGETEIDTYVRGTSEPEIDAYVENKTKPEIDGYVAKVSKPDLDRHTEDKKENISQYVATVSKPDIDAYIENTAKPDISDYAADRVAEYDANAAAKQEAVDASALAAANSAAAAKTSEINSSASMVAAAASAQSAANSETEALNSETAAAISEARCEEIFARLGTVIKIKGRVDTTEDLPQTGNLDGDAYLVGVAGLTAYPEYYWFSDHWEFLGTSADKIEWGTLQGSIANQTDLQTALIGKQNVITGAASTIVDDNLTAARVVITDENGKIANSEGIDTAELNCLDNITGNIQEQLDGKQSTANLSQTLDDSTDKYPSNAAVKAAVDAKDSLPAQSGNEGKFLTTDGSSASWGTVDVSGAIEAHNTDLNAHDNKFQVVSVLPDSPAEGVFYFIKE